MTTIGLLCLSGLVGAGLLLWAARAGMAEAEAVRRRPHAGEDWPGGEGR